MVMVVGQLEAGEEPVSLGLKAISRRSPLKRAAKMRKVWSVVFPRLKSWARSKQAL
jgi:hypothetical protein